MYIGRFAPTPSGPLHFGSIVTAIASFLDAKSNQGKWLVKIDDIDQPRIRKGAELQILNSLEKLGLIWDGDVIHQSERKEHYQSYVNDLKEKGLLYNCRCTRKTVNGSSATGADGSIYNGTCREKYYKEEQGASLRIKVVDKTISIADDIQGAISQNLSSEIGDFIVKRSDNIFSYQLSVAVDNHLDNITHIVRGYDLLNSLPRQYYLHEVMGFNFPKSSHIPIVTLKGRKLSKGYGDSASIQNCERLVWINALTFLGQPTKDYELIMNIDEIISQAIINWSAKRVMRSSEKEIDGHIHK
jgi:glutamyl-Q tRNA(Asp) synthetase|tara:strand:+ start:505 stop:1404 length:900 start_codon:yes stop_codon:yes gene_type:complete